MHELSYCEGVLEAVERRAAGRTVTAIGVRIGAVHRIVADAFEQSFPIAAVARPAAGPATEVGCVPVRGPLRGGRPGRAVALGGNGGWHLAVVLGGGGACWRGSRDFGPVAVCHREMER